MTGAALVADTLDELPDAGGHRDGAVLGGRLARLGISAGLAGYVVHGAVRDVDDLDSLALPVWSLQTHPAGERAGSEAAQLAAWRRADPAREGTTP